jgi:hypothetical protein
LPSILLSDVDGKLDVRCKVHRPFGKELRGAINGNHCQLDRIMWVTPLSITIHGSKMRRCILLSRNQTMISHIRDHRCRQTWNRCKKGAKEIMKHAFVCRICLRLRLLVIACSFIWCLCLGTDLYEVISSTFQDVDRFRIKLFSLTGIPPVCGIRNSSSSAGRSQDMNSSRLCSAATRSKQRQQKGKRSKPVSHATTRSTFRARQGEIPC